MARFVHLTGHTDYEEIHSLQQALVDARARDQIADTVLLLEHSPVITVGRTRGAEANVLASAGVPVIPVKRGGDVTWHGPGQLVAYPIVKLEGRRADLHLHLRSLEDAVIALLLDLGLSPQRDARNTGVWLPADPLPQKVCSIGIACRRWVSWHGLALNVDVDLAWFDRIRPCGFDAGVMTSLSAQLQTPPTIADLLHPLAGHLAVALDIEMGHFETLDKPADIRP